MKGATPAPAVQTPEVVTVAVTMPLALYRRFMALDYYDSRNRRLDVSAAVVEQMEAAVQCWLETRERQGPQPAEYLAEFERELDAGMYPSVYPPPLAVQLDQEAARLVRWVRADDPAFTFADMVNGSVRYHYGEETERGGIIHGDACLEAARAARLGKEAA